MNVQTKPPSDQGSDAAAIVAVIVYGLGTLLSFALPEPRSEKLED